MNSNFLNYLKQFHFVEKKDRILLAVSGGADSMFLLHHILNLREEYELDLLVAHYNHGVRKRGYDDEAFVRSFCQKYKIPIVVGYGDMNQYAEEHHLSSEEAGRILRYEFFHKVAQGRKIFTAHNRKDQAETLLLRIFRGTGIEGLCGIPEQRGDIYRPMLQLSREEILHFFEKKNFSYCVDETNDTLDYQRNRVRNELMPYLMKSFNPNLEETLVRLCQIAKDHCEILEEVIREIKGIEEKSLYLPEFINYSQAIQREGIRFLFKKIFPSEEILSYDKVKQVQKLMYSESGKTLDLGHHIVARKSYDRIFMEKKVLNTKEEGQFLLTFGNNETPFGHFYVSEIEHKVVNQRHCITIDKNKVKGNLFLRHRRQGDRFTPLGMKGTKKLKDFFVDQKIDRKLRDHIILLCDEENIIWIIGYRLSEKYRVRKDTKEIISVEARDVRY